MSRLVLFFLSCLMTLTWTAAGAPKAVNSVPHPDVQCRSADQLAACYGYFHNGDVVDCMDLKCVAKNARQRKSDGMIRGLGIGKALDGTHCNINKVCRNGICTELARHERMPIQEGANRALFQCYFKS